MARLMNLIVLHIIWYLNLVVFIYYSICQRFYQYNKVFSLLSCFTVCRESIFTIYGSRNIILWTECFHTSPFWVQASLYHKLCLIVLINYVFYINYIEKWRLIYLKFVLELNIHFLSKNTHVTWIFYVFTSIYVLN